MRTRSLHIALALCSVASAQVTIDRPIEFTASDSTMRQIEGIAYPQSEENALTYGTAQAGGVHWGTGSMAGDTLLINLTPTLNTAYGEGLLVRVMAPTASGNSLYVNVDGMGAAPVLRTDGLPVGTGDVAANEVIQLQHGNGAFHLIGRSSSGCPTGFIRANSQFCMQIDENPETTWVQAAETCARMGARLCTWDQYLYACERTMPQLNHLFDNWEWIDDTSDHTHTGDQAGRWNCVTQRSVGIVNNDLGHSRCCYRTR